MDDSGKIWRDQNGVCHIGGADKAEAFRLMGYAHAKDRGMQMLVMRILGQGRASEILDSSDEMLSVDKFFRRMNWAGTVAEEVGKLTAETKELNEAYCQGVNAAFSEKIPWECRLFGYKPEPWRVEDSILFLRMIGYLTLAQSQGEMERLLIEMVQAGMDRERLNELFPGILGGMDMELMKKVRLEDRLVSPASLWNIAAPVMMASNSWVVSGEKTASGKPILANDPHLEINRLPNVWYEVVMKAGDRHGIGATMPGVAGLLIGRTPELAWGATYPFSDCTDSWIEKCKDGAYFREPDEWVPFQAREEIVKRKKKDPVKVTFYENPHGTLEGDPNEEGYYLATAWAPGSAGAATNNKFVEIFDAKTVEQGMNLLGELEVSFDWVIVDNRGNIGYQMSGLVPKRRDGISGFVALPGWKPENAWQGFEKPEDLPRSYNPECGYFVAANQDKNEHGKADPTNVGMGAYRSDRIAQVLAVNDRLTREDMYRLQLDVYSIQAKEFMKILAPMLPDSREAEILKNWNFEYDADSEGAFIFEEFYRNLYREVFGKNGFGSDAVDYMYEHTGVFTDFYLNFDRILLSAQSAWFGGRTREEIYRRAVEDALKNPPKKWGETRKVLLKNIVFDAKMPKFLGFDRGPITLVGGRATPHQGQIYESGGRQTTFAPSYRMVIDMADAAVYTNMAGGPSDRRFSKWYCSDLENWQLGQYKKISVTPDQTYISFK